MLKINVNSELIRKFSEVIQGILSMIEKGEYEKALELIDGAFKDFFRLGSKFFNSLSEENLLELARTNSIMDVDKCIIMAKLLMEEARVFEKLHDKNGSFYLYAKSLYLYVEAYEYAEEETDLDTYFSDIETLIIKVSDYKGAYDKADNILYDLLEETGFSEESKGYAAEIYKALLSREDAELVKGNLTREEVMESLESISC